MNKTIVRSMKTFLVVLILSLFTGIGVYAKSDFKIKKVDEGKTTALLKYTGSESRVVVPNGVQFVASGAFADNKKVKEVVLPSSVTEIGENTFGGCTNLKKINIPKNVKRIWTAAFARCEKLQTITLNKKLRYIDEFAFVGCKGLKRVKIQKGNKRFKIYKGALYSKNMKNLYLYPAANKKRKKYTIPSKVKGIEAYAFSGNQYLNKIVVKGRVKSGEGVFSKCKSLKEIVFKKAYIDAPQFSNCKKLKKVVLAEGTDIIADSQFEGCKNLTTINFPSSLKRIDMYAFSGCPKIKKPTFSTNIKVHKQAFD